MKLYVDKISELTLLKGIKHEIHSFDSGAFMIDLWINNDFYCIQLLENKFGISQITEDIDFNTIPDKIFTKWENFKKELERIINE